MMLSSRWLTTTANEKLWRSQGWVLAGLVVASFFPPLFRLEEYVFYGCLLLAFLVMTAERNWSKLRNPLEVPLGLLLGWILLTIPFSADPAYSFSEWRKLLSQVFIFYWALVVLRNNHVGIMCKRISLLVVFGTMIVCGWALYDYIKRGGGVIPDLDLRANLPFSGPQWLSSYTILTLPFVALGGLFGKEIWLRLFCWVTFFLAGLALFFALQRGAWLAFVCQVVLLMLLLKRGLLQWIIGLGIVLMGGIFALSFTGYLDDVLNTESIQYRWAVWKLGMQQLGAHPLVGIGYGNDILVRSFSEYEELANAKHLHNIFLMMGVGSGIMALLVLIVLLGKITTLLVGALPSQCIRRVEDGIVVGVLLMVVGFTIRNSFDYMLIGSMACLFWILVALGVVVATATGRAKTVM